MDGPTDVCNCEPVELPRGDAECPSKVGDNDTTALVIDHMVEAEICPCDPCELLPPPPNKVPNLQQTTNIFKTLTPAFAHNAEKHS